MQHTTSSTSSTASSAAGSGAKLSAMSIFFLGVDGIIGSGIFLLPGTLYKDAGNLSLMLIFLAAAAALLFGLCYAEMASRTTGNGAAWLYAYNAFGEGVGFEIGLFSWIQGFATIATETAAFLTALKILVPALASSVVYNIAGLVTILLLMCIGLLGEHVSKIANNGSTILKIAVLVVFIATGIFFINMGHFNSDAVYKSSTVNSAFILTFYMYSGFSFLPVAARRMNNPQKNLPRMLISVLIAVSIVYMAAVFVAIGMLGPKIAESSAPLALAFAEHFGIVGKVIIIIGMCGSILGVAMSVSYSTPFIASSLATEHHLLPDVIGKTLPSGTPYIAVLLTGILSGLLVVSGGYLFLVPVTVLIAVIQYITTAFATIKAQREMKIDPQSATGFHLKFGYLVPGLALAFCVYILFNIEHKVLIMGAIALACGAILYRIFKATQTKKDTEKSQTTTAK